MKKPKPFQKWNPLEIREKLLPPLMKADVNELPAFIPALDKLESLFQSELEASTKALAEFKVSGDVDSRVLGVLAEIMSRPHRYAVQVARDKVFVVNQARRLIAKRIKAG